ncbi:MAG: threonine ammonia-lyase [Alphaproteobacteria bacterium]|nr:threonine ammonia-lyase [Alphaproteobacteria bacterium]
MSDVRVEDIRAAATLLNGIVWPTPTSPARRLSATLGVDVALKLENLQLTGSFKARGAFVKLDSLDAGQRARGVIAMSAGNHAQGVAFHCQRLGIPATIVMPKSTPYTKVERTAALGATVKLKGSSLAEAADYARERAQAKALAFIHPYDDPLIVAGQGTVGLEMIFARPDLDVIVVPIGGGGLIAGIATAVKALKPSITVIGVQTQLYPDMARRFGKDVPDRGDIALATLAEGIAVKSPGRLTGRIVAALVDDIVLVSETAVERAVNLLMAEEKLVAEGAGAAALAAMLTEPARFAGRKVGLVISGGNIDQRMLASILMRGLARDARIARLRIEINDAPGMLAKVSGAIAAAGGNIIEIYHQRLFSDVPVMRADLDVLIETRGAAHLAEIEARLAREGFASRRLGNTAGA